MQLFVLGLALLVHLVSDGFKTVFTGPPCMCCVLSSHLVTVATGPRLSDALISSPIIVEDGAAVPGAGFEFGVDPNEDPELALVTNTHFYIVTYVCLDA